MQKPEAEITEVAYVSPKPNVAETLLPKVSQGRMKVLDAASATTNNSVQDGQT
jgi:hypothetical protein